MIRILHSVSNMDRAGIETMLMNYYRHIDRDIIQFDFLCNKTKPGAYDDEIKQMGGRIFHSPGLNPVKYSKYLTYMKEIFDTYPEYKILEAHNGALGVYALYAAKMNCIPHRIFHAHGASITKDWKLPIKLVCKRLLPYNMNIHYSCGVAAAECYFGKKVVEKEDFTLIPNAIEVDRFIFNTAIRNKIREMYCLEGKRVIGHVGRFMAQKNHAFVLEVFAEIYKKDKDMCLVLLGDGELFSEMKQKAVNLSIEEAVKFIGNVSNVNEWYQAFDLFILPSIWEGLPVVGVEAQTSDLPCIFSSSITKEIAITDKTKFIDLNEPIDTWVTEIQKSLTNTIRKNNEALITKCGYNIKNEAKKLEERYIKLYGGANENRNINTSVHK
ncbi:glycosyltransferase family 1 protein [Clostridium culturomicium]|uniref:glycosyltransferase family 1 protein n=1 Tax=Clostridium culturomicium TaxID=1499683 RepID=UPI0038577614